jgi:hypothetical protein
MHREARPLSVSCLNMSKAKGGGKMSILNRDQTNLNIEGAAIHKPSIGYYLYKNNSVDIIPITNI